jgi:hypothetical protein
MTRLDGAIEVAETAALAKLGEALKIPPAPREHADQIAQEIALLGEGDRPARYDLKRLRDTLGARLDEAQRLKATESEKG